jgi:hypothetical protein
MERAMTGLSRRLGEALGSAGAPEPTTAEAWKDALMTDSVYLCYTYAAPLAALGAWHLTDTPLDAYARRLALSVADERLRLFYEDMDGNFFVCETAVSELPDLELDTPCFFAFERGGAFAKAEPLQLVPAQNLAFASVDAGPYEDIVEAAGLLLRRLGIDPDTPFKHDVENGVRYVDFHRECFVGMDGRIYYNNPDSGEHLLSPRTDVPLLGYIEAARAMCNTLSGALGDADWELRAVEPGDGGVLLRFGVHMGGVPILDSGGAYALLTIAEDGRLAEAHFYIRAYRSQDGAAELMPVEQAIAAIPDSAAGLTLTAAYLDDGDSPLTAQWVRRSEALR